jgi:hypothetical protein
VIRDEHLQQQRGRDQKHRGQMAVSTDRSGEHVPHGRDVGGNIEDIGSQQQSD